MLVDCGFNFSFEGEFIPPATGGDRRYLTLHSEELKLIREASRLNPRLAVAITAGASVIVEDFVDEEGFLKLDGL